MTLDEAQIQQCVGRQLTRLADKLDTMPDVAELPSLCDGWTVTNVLAHMTMPARYDLPAFMAELAAVDNDFDRLSELIAHRDGLLPFERLVDDLRTDTMAQWVPPGGGARGALSHAVIHGLDITSAIDVERTCDDDACRLVLDFLTSDAATSFGGDASRISVRAVDVDWQHGTGNPNIAEAADIILALANRPRPGLHPTPATR